MRVRASVPLALTIGVLAAAPAAGGPVRAHGPAVDPATLVKYLSTGTLALPGSLSGGTFGGVGIDGQNSLYAGVTVGANAYIAVYDANGSFQRSFQVDNRIAARGELFLAV